MNILNNKIISFSSFIILTGIFIYSVFIPSVQKINTDFPNYYVSANMYLDGKDMKTAYDNILFNRELQLYGINDQVVSCTPYPPLTALLFVPLARMEPLDAKLVWNIMNLLILAGCVLLLSKIAEINFIHTALIFFLSGFALANNFLLGQAYLPVLLFLLLGIFFMQEENDIPAGLFIALSIVLKFFTVFFIFLFIFKKRYRLLAYTIVFTAIIYIPVILLTGFDLNYFYYTAIMPRLGDGWVGTVYAPEYQSWLSLLHRWFSYEPALNPNPLAESNLAFYFFKYAWIFFILTLAVSAVKKTNNNFREEISLFCITCLLLLPVNASYQFVILVPAAVIIFKYYSDRQKFIAAAAVVLLMFIMNSHVQVYITNVFKNTPLYIFAYIKLAGLLIFFWLNISILKNINAEKLFNSRSLRFLAIGGVHVVVLTGLSYFLNKPGVETSEYVNLGSNYIYSTPASYNNRLVWTEPVNERFVLRSNFGFKYDKHSVYFPVFTDSQHIAFEYIENKTPKQIVVDLITGIERDASGIILNTRSSNKNKTVECYSKEGAITLEDPSTGKHYPLTSVRQMCTYPVFADDSTIVYASDKNRGVGFTAIYKVRVK